MDIARRGHLCVVDRATALADLPVGSVRSGHGWFGVRSGASSNDLNFVVSEPGFVPGDVLLTELLQWLAGVPASWLVREPDAALTQVLCRAGLRPERTGRWCGRALGQEVIVRGEAQVVRVRGEGDLGDWIDIAASCGWCDTLPDREVRLDVMRALIRDNRSAAWVAWLEGSPVGMAAGWCDGPSVAVVDVAVRERARRHAVATALVADVLAWGAEQGASQVVAEPSHAGWLLFNALGFDNVPVVPDVCFYLP